MLVDVMRLIVLQRGEGQQAVIELTRRLEHGEWVPMNVNELRAWKKSAELTDFLRYAPGS